MLPPPPTIPYRIPPLFSYATAPVVGYSITNIFHSEILRAKEDEYA